MVDNVVLLCITLDLSGDRIREWDPGVEYSGSELRQLNQPQNSGKVRIYPEWDYKLSCIPGVSLDNLGLYMNRVMIADTETNQLDQLNI